MQLVAGNDYFQTLLDCRSTFLIKWHQQFQKDINLHFSVMYVKFRNNLFALSYKPPKSHHDSGAGLFEYNNTGVSKRNWSLAMMIFKRL